jgi:hypothetical protein
MESGKAHLTALVRFTTDFSYCGYIPGHYRSVRKDSFQDRP